jgi:putative oxidoreductase
MLQNLFGPYADLGLLILRVGLAVVMISHGLPKLNANSPMKGIPGVTGFLKQLNVPMPTFFAWVLALLETVGAVLLIIGLGTRILAVGYVIDMLVAIWLVKMRMMKAPFSGQNGWDFEFSLLIIALALIFTGSGRYGVDLSLGL